MENIDDLERAVNRKQRKFDILATEHQARVDRQQKLFQEQSYHRDRENFWIGRAEQLEAEAQKARQKAGNALERRLRAERVLGDVNWDKDAQERLERFEQLEKLKKILSRIKELDQKHPENGTEASIIRDSRLQLEKEFKSVKGSGV